MRVFADKLNEQLSRQLNGCYLVFGNEPLLLQESRDAIITTARQAGFDEKHTFIVDSQINWPEVHDAFQALSLFSSRQIIELEIPEAGINAAASKELVSLSDSLHGDILLLISGSKLTKQQENAKWFKSLSKHGTWVSCISPDIQRLPQFVRNRCRVLGLKPDAQALQMLAQWHEGNLLALAQSLEKLTLLYPDGELNLVRVEEALSRHNHFTPFHWIDALLAGKPKRSQRILKHLESEGTEPVILLRTLQRELTLLAKLTDETAHSQPGPVFDKHRIWQSKRPLYSAALQRLDHKAIAKLFKLLAQAELQAKTSYDEPVWPLLANISIEVCTPMALRPLALPYAN